mgnify:CR=1 FL=1
MITTDSLNQTTASGTCSTLGAELVHVTDENENEFVMEALSRSGAESAWTSLLSGKSVAHHKIFRRICRISISQLERRLGFQKIVFQITRMSLPVIFSFMTKCLIQIRPLVVDLFFETGQSI